MSGWEWAEKEADIKNKPERTIETSLAWGCILMMGFWIFILGIGLVLWSLLQRV